MTNREIIEKSVSDMSITELRESAIVAKNLLTIITNKMTEQQRNEIFSQYGVSDIDRIMKTVKL